MLRRSFYFLILFLASFGVSPFSLASECPLDFLSPGKAQGDQDKRQSDKIKIYTDGMIVNISGQAPEPMVRKGHIVVSEDSGQIMEVLYGCEVGDHPFAYSLNSKYVVPGLIDPNVYLWGMLESPVSAERNVYLSVREFGPRLLRGGVTTVFGANGTQKDFTGQLKEGAFTARELQKKGEIQSPQIHVAGPIFVNARTSYNSVHNDFINVLDEENLKDKTPLEYVRAYVDEYKPDHLTFVHRASRKTAGVSQGLSKEELKALLSVAEERQLKAIAYVSTWSDMMEVLTAHSSAPVAFAYSPENFDDPLSADVLKLMKEKNVRIITSFNFYLNPHTMAYSAAEYTKNELYRQTVPAGILADFATPKASWDQEGQNSWIGKFYVGDSPEPQKNLGKYAALKRYLAAGIEAIVGTGSGLPGAYHGPGMIHEMKHWEKALVKDSMSALERKAQRLRILSAATGQVGRMMNINSGRIARGMSADFLILEKSPLDRLDHLETMDYLVQDGQRIDVKNLEGLESSY